MTAILRLILTSAACFGLWRLWRAIDTIDRRAAMIAGVGLLIRLVAGQTLFWISWLKLPFARSLQLGSGLWFYAIDGQWYLQYADKILGQGPATVLTIDATYPSRVFVQVLTIAVAAFGHVASVALLLNAFAFLEGDFRGRDLDLLVDLNGVAVDDLAVECQRDFDRERAFA